MLIFRIIVTTPLVRHLPASQVKWSFTICTLAMWVTRVGFNQKLDISKVSFFANVVQRSVATLITKLGLVYSRLGITAPLYDVSCYFKVTCLDMLGSLVPRRSLVPTRMRTRERLGTRLPNISRLYSQCCQLLRIV